MDPIVKQQRRGAILLLVFFALAMGTFGGVLIATGLDWVPHTLAQSTQPAQVEPSTFLLDTQRNFREMVTTVRPAVVTILARGVEVDYGGLPDYLGDPYEWFFDLPDPFDRESIPEWFDPPERERERDGERDREWEREEPFYATSEGSGFLVDPDGYILTNNHVVKGASAVWVIMSDGRRYHAEIVGTDPETDVAVLKVNIDDGLPYIEMGNSEDLHVGDWVMAIGNPFGTLAGTVTVGIISALNREDIWLPAETYYKDFIQTDAAINLGNSGGPLIDIYGRAVGINTAITSRGSGIGFAIPINLARFVYESLRDHGAVVRGWVGLTIQDIDHDLAQHFGPGHTHVALVADVLEGDPADQAGLQSGDVVVEVAGQEILGKSAATRIIAMLPVGEPSQFLIWRDGEEMSLMVTPARRGEGPMRAEDEELEEVEEKDEEAAHERTWEGDDLGINVRDLTAGVRRRNDIPDEITGVLIIEVDDMSPAVEKGIFEGFVIQSVNGQTVESEDEYWDLIDAAYEEWLDTGESVLMNIVAPMPDGTWRGLYYAVPFQ